MSSHWFGQHGAQPANAGQVPVVTSILKDFSAEALGELRTWLEQNPPAVTIQSIIGFSQFVAQVASPVSTRESRTSSTYGDLATVGPTLTGLSNGKYLLMYGSASSVAVAVSAAGMSIQTNSTVAVATDECATGVVNDTSVMIVTAKTLTEGNNTVTAKYRSSDGATAASFSNRWLIALRYSNA